MATGDSSDLLRRLKGYLPPWFADTSPLVDAVFGAVAMVMAFIYSLIVYAQLQTRIATASGGWLDLIASDFFGSSLTRAYNQSDSSFRTQILANIFRERGTRRAITQILTDLTGSVPLIFEPSRVQDAGAYRGPFIGYGAAGAYGSLLLPYQGFVTAFRPLNNGIPNVAGYGVSTGGYSTPSRAEWASLDMIANRLTDAAIYAAVDSVKVAGTKVWVRINNPTTPIPVTYPSLSLNGGQLFLNGGKIRTLFGA